MNEKIYFTYLHTIGFSQAELLSVFGENNISPKEVYENISESYLETLGFSQARRKIITQGKEKFIQNKGEEKNYKALKELSVNLITYNDAEYPDVLRNISHTPFLLYVRGKIPNQEMFAIVGSRKITSYGKKVIERIVPDIVKVFPIVSGGAAGCDTYAHLAVLKSQSLTVAVIGTGIDQNYPVSNSKMYDSIVEKGGAIVSIFRIGEPGNPYNFPVRNEIVVGLSKGVLVVEAAEKSGSLITANLALDGGKDVFAIPGDILHDSSRGCNHLIQSGQAKLVSHSIDILEEYDILVKTSAHSSKIPSLTSSEKQIYDCLKDCEADTQSLIQYTGKTSAEILIQLSLLELKGLVKKDISGKYRIT